MRTEPGQSHVTGRETDMQAELVTKTEADSRMVRGFVHHWSNLMTGIIGYAVELLAGVPEGDPRRHDLERVLALANDGAVMTRHLRDFCGTEPLGETAIVNLNLLVARVIPPIEKMVGDAIELHRVMRPTSGRCRVNADQIEQVVVGLATNAAHAMPRGGRLTIETRNESLDDPRLARRIGVRPGQYVTVCVADTGTGMSDETMRRIFEPFFTTREVGEGTGLGLSVAYGVVRRHEGGIAVQSEVGRGSSFTLYLPRVEEGG